VVLDATIEPRSETGEPFPPRGHSARFRGLGSNTRIRRGIGFVVFVLAVAPCLGAQPPTDPDPDLTSGIRQLVDGDPATAAVTLGAAIARLRKSGVGEKDLAVAHVYLAMAYVGLHQPDRADVTLRQACRSDESLQLDPSHFPPGIIELFRQAAARHCEPGPTLDSPADSSSVGQSGNGKSRRSRRALLVGMAAAGAVTIAGVVVAAGSRGSSSNPGQGTLPSSNPRPSAEPLSPAVIPMTRIGPGTITYVNAAPPPGSRLNNCAVNTPGCRIDFVFDIKSDLRRVKTPRLFVSLYSDIDELCYRGISTPFSMDAGEEFRVGLSLLHIGCQPPTTITRLLVIFDSDDFQPPGTRAVEQEFQISYGLQEPRP
jgi:hypothetical protein